MRIYVDTSVIGGCFDEEFSEWSNKLFDSFKNGKNIIVISDTTLEELQNAPSRVSDVLEKVPNEFKEFIILNEETLNLAEKYITENIVTKKFLLDTRHIALATVYKVDVLVSWNFNHIVNYNKIRLYNSVNLKFGYLLIEIRSPREIVYEN